MFKTVEKIHCYCDCCGKRIKPNSDPEFLMYPVYRTRVWDTRKLFEHLCKRCVGNLDKALLKMQNDLIEREKIMIRNKALNEQRKKELNTKG